MNRCPSHDELQQLLHSDPGSAAHQEMETHVDACPACNQTLEDLIAAIEEPWQRLRRATRGERLGGPTGAFLEELKGCPPAPTEASDDAPDDGAPFPTISGFDVLEELGRGGMGVVYKARQQALNRLVALKMILPDRLHGEQERSRFRTEAEAAARLQHPNFVQIHEVGERGRRPYLVMELVEGDNLARRLGGSPQPIGWSAALVETLARAVHHAHQKGIVHRDLKPANILLSPLPDGGEGSGERGLGTPKITDFGLAKQLGVERRQSATGDFLGTPSYMAPEQVDLKLGPIGPATDLHALGAILYELLTGRPPFRGATVLETLEQVRHQEPVPPRQLRPNVPRDLETICLKCLRKEPAKRYASAATLADDLRRFLHGEPIQARPVRQLERLWRWSRRNRLAATLVVVLVTAFAGVTWQWLRADANFRDSEENLLQARNALSYINEMSQLELGGLSGAQSSRKNVLDESLRYYQHLHQQRPNDPYVQRELADNYFRLGMVANQIGKDNEALAMYRKAAVLEEEVLDRFTDPLPFRNHLAAIYLYIGFHHRKVGNLQEALRSHQDALSILEELVRAKSSQQSWYKRQKALNCWAIGNVWVELDKLDTARSYYEKAYSLRKEYLKEEHQTDPDARDQVADSQASLGWLDYLAGKPSAALDSLNQARDIRAQLVQEDHRNIWWRFHLDGADLCLGIVLRAKGEPDIALSALVRAGTDLELLVGDNPEVNEFHLSLAEVHLNIGKLWHDKRRHAEALVRFEQARQVCLHLLDDNPAVTQTRVVLAESTTWLGLAQHALGQKEATLRSLQRGQVVWQRLVDDHPDIPRFRDGLASVGAEIAGR
jgi:eukaryotic-like serine/threonine-protein kinase